MYLDLFILCVALLRTRQRFIIIIIVLLIIIIRIISIITRIILMIRLISKMVFRHIRTTYGKTMEIIIIIITPRTRWKQAGLQAFIECKDKRCCKRLGCCGRSAGQYQLVTLYCVATLVLDDGRWLMRVDD